MLPNATYTTDLGACLSSQLKQVESPQAKSFQLLGQDDYSKVKVQSVGGLESNHEVKGQAHKMSYIEASLKF